MSDRLRYPKTEEEKIIQWLTQALKDIINAAGNDDPYTREELKTTFSIDYQLGYEYLHSRGIQELA
jgi:hypothetical protein